jgi:hypothetical protein
MEDYALTKSDLEILTYISDKFRKIRQLNGTFDDIDHLRNLMLITWSEKNKAFKHVINIL